MPDKTADSLARILSLSSQAPPSADSDGEHLAPAAGPEFREQGLSALSWHGEDAGDRAHLSYLAVEEAAHVGPGIAEWCSSGSMEYFTRELAFEHPLDAPEEHAGGHEEHADGPANYGNFHMDPYGPEDRDEAGPGGPSSAPDEGAGEDTAPDKGADEDARENAGAGAGYAGSARAVAGAQNADAFDWVDAGVAHEKSASPVAGDDAAGGTSIPQWAFHSLPRDCLLMLLESALKHVPQEAMAAMQCVRALAPLSQAELAQLEAHGFSSRQIHSLLLGAGVGAKADVGAASNTYARGDRARPFAGLGGKGIMPEGAAGGRARGGGVGGMSEGLQAAHGGARLMRPSAPQRDRGPVVGGGGGFVGMGARSSMEVSQKAWAFSAVGARVQAEAGEVGGAGGAGGAGGLGSGEMRHGKIGGGGAEVLRSGAAAEGRGRGGGGWAGAGGWSRRGSGPCGAGRSVRGGLQGREAGGRTAEAEAMALRPALTKTISKAGGRGAIRLTESRSGTRTSVLTEDQAIEVFVQRPKQRSDRAGLCSDLADKYAVTTTAIRHIWDRRTWVWTTMPFWSEAEMEASLSEGVCDKCRANHVSAIGQTCADCPINRKRGRPRGQSRNRSASSGFQTPDKDRPPVKLTKSVHVHSAA